MLCLPSIRYAHWKSLPVHRAFGLLRTRPTRIPVRGGSLTCWESFCSIPIGQFGLQSPVHGFDSRLRFPTFPRQGKLPSWAFSSWLPGLASRCFAHSLRAAPDQPRRTNKEKRPFQEGHHRLQGGRSGPRRLDDLGGLDEDFTACDTGIPNQFFRAYHAAHGQGGTNAKQRNLSAVARPPEESSYPCGLGICGTADGLQVTQDCFSVISPGNLAVGFSREGRGCR
jgi:hypothetical protein